METEELTQEDFENKVPLIKLTDEEIKFVSKVCQENEIYNSNELFAFEYKQDNLTLRQIGEKMHIGKDTASKLLKRANSNPMLKEFYKKLKFSCSCEREFEDIYLSPREDEALKIISKARGVSPEDFKKWDYSLDWEVVSLTQLFNTSKH